MKDSISRGPSLENGSTNGEDTKPEMMTADMLIHKRVDDDVDDQNVKGGHTNINIKVLFGSNQYDLSVPSDSTFGGLKRRISEEIGVESKVQKLLFRGIEKEDEDYLHVAGVKNNSKVLLTEEEAISDNHMEIEIEIPEEVEAGPVEISVGEEAVAKVKVEIDTLSEQVLALEAVIGSKTKVDEKDIIYLTEMLMRQLLKLDGIEAQGEGRVQRKTEVRRVQSLVEKVDSLKAMNCEIVSETNNGVPVTTKWETFENGVGNVTSSPSIPAEAEVTQN